LPHSKALRANACDIPLSPPAIGFPEVDCTVRQIVHLTYYCNHDGCLLVEGSTGRPVEPLFHPTPFPPRERSICGAQAREALMKSNRLARISTHPILGMAALLILILRTTSAQSPTPQMPPPTSTI